jgi:multicomponent Na+:H+ antiporter subunit D
MWRAHLPALAVAAPLTVATIAALLRTGTAAWAFATVASGVSFLIALLLAGAVGGVNELSYELGSWPVPYGIELRITSFSALLLVIITGASSMALLGGRRSLDAAITPARRPFFYAAWLLAMGGMSGIVASGDAFNIFVFMEVS